MFAKSFLKDMKYYNDESNQLVELISAANDNGMNEITIPYLLKNMKISQGKLYDCVHELIDLDILDIEEYSICPQCLFHNILEENGLTRCKRCKSVYNPNRTLEKLKLVNK